MFTDARLHVIFIVEAKTSVRMCLIREEGIEGVVALPIWTPA